MINNETNIEIDTNSACMFVNDLTETKIDDEFRIRTLLTAINLVRDFKNQLQELEAVYTIFEPIVTLLKSYKFTNYPSNVKNHIKEIYKELKLLQNKKLNYIVLAKKRPKPLKMYEPLYKITVLYSIIMIYIFFNLFLFIFYYYLES